MNLLFRTAGVFLTGFLITASASAKPVSGITDTKPTEASTKKFQQALDDIENLRLPLNKVFLYRESAVALMATNRPQAILLLNRALGDIDLAEAKMRNDKTLDQKSLNELEFHRLPVIMLMERIDANEALRLLSPPQTADRDMAFQALFFERLHDPQKVYQFALHKLDYGASPATVGAYDVLKKSAPAAAKELAMALVLRLGKSDPTDPDAIRAALGLLRLLRKDVGALAPEMILDSNLLGEDQVRDLFSFIADAFLAAKDPEMLIVGERPGLYLSALDVYAPVKAQDVKLLPFAAPDAVSTIFSPEVPQFDANHPDSATLTPEQNQQRAALRERVDVQVRSSNEQIALLSAISKDGALPQKDRDDAVFAAVEQANKALILARSGSTTLEREAFRGGEVEFYNLGAITNVIDGVSKLLQDYSAERPQVAEDASRKLDGYEVQTEISLQVSIHEMTGAQPFLVPPAPKPLDKPSEVAPPVPAHVTGRGTAE